jgi:hypothetical protein
MESEHEQDTEGDSHIEGVEIMTLPSPVDIFIQDHLIYKETIGEKYVCPKCGWHEFRSFYSGNGDFFRAINRHMMGSHKKFWKGIGGMKG